MASNTSRIIFKFAVPSIFGLLAILFLKKKKSNTSCTVKESKTSAVNIHSSIKLKSESNPIAKSVILKMLLKDTESHSDSKCNGVQCSNLPSEVYSENGVLSAVNGGSPITNGVSSISNGVSSTANGVPAATNDVAAATNVSVATNGVAYQKQAYVQCKVSYAAALKDNSKVNGPPMKYQSKENGVSGKSSSHGKNANQNGLPKQTVHSNLSNGVSNGINNNVNGISDCLSNKTNGVAAITSNSANRFSKSKKKNKSKAPEKNYTWPAGISTRTCRKDNTLVSSDNKDTLTNEFSQLTVNECSLQEASHVSKSQNIDLNSSASNPTIQHTSSGTQLNSVSVVQTIDTVAISQNESDFVAETAMSDAVESSCTESDLVSETIAEDVSSDELQISEDIEAAKECDMTDQAILIEDQCPTPESGRVSETPSETAETLQIDINGHLNYPDDLVASGGQEMLPSPDAAYCDSVGSNDSGRGGSEVGNETRMGYEFLLPAKDCGYLIGKKGNHVNFIKEKTNAVVYIRPYPWVQETKIVSIIGDEQETAEALKLIRKRFDPAIYPNLTFERVNISNGEIFCPPSLSLSLPQGVEFQVVLSATITAGNFFIQLPTHPSYHALPPFCMSMMSMYTHCTSPPVTNPSIGNIVAAPLMNNGWFRAEIMELLDEDMCRLKYLDYGGYQIVPISTLRQINIEFMQMPFQGIECYLANVTCHEELGWTEESKMAFESLAQGQILSAFVAGVAADGIPCLYLYKVSGATNTFINQYLVEAGYLKWVTYENDVPSAEVTEVTEA